MVTMVERMAKVETKIDNLDDKMTKFIESADAKYAGKWIEKLNYTVIVGFVTAIVTKIVGLW